MPAREQSEFLNLPFRQKLEFLYGLPARQKRDLILSAPEAERLVQSFSPETLFYTLKEIGSADAGDLLSLALPEQVKSLFDLDCWEKDRPCFERIAEWIEAMAEGGRSRMAEALMQLDLEMVALLLRRYIRIHRVDDPESSPDAPSNRFVQFDEHHLVEFIRHDAVTPHILDFLEEIFERDYNYFAALIDETYWGLEAELEEQAYQFRRARLSDRGFPDFFDAQDVFAYIDPRQFLEIRSRYQKPERSDLLADGETILASAAPVIPGTDDSLFNLALTAGFAADGRHQLRSEMAMVSNQVLVAQAIDFGDLDAVKATVEMTHNYLNLALEHLAAGELQRAIDHLRETHLKLLFRLGVSLTMDLRRRARAVSRKFAVASDKREIPCLDTPYREALVGFLERRPRFFTGLEQPGMVEMRDFRSIRDLHLGYATVEQVEMMPELFRELLGIDISAVSFRALAAGSDLRLSQLLLTAFARRALDGVLRPEPIEESRLGAMRSAMMVQEGPVGRLSDRFRHLVNAVMEERLGRTPCSRAANFVNSCLNMAEEELAELNPDRPIDPRFIKSVLVRRG